MIDHSNEKITYALMDRVFIRFNVPVEIFINQGMQFHEKFQELCEKTLINYRITSQNYLEGDGVH